MSAASTTAGTVRPRPRILPRQILTTRDGVELCGDVYRPPEPAAAPVVLVRTPYGRSQPFLLRLALQLNHAGLAVVLQDCRGRFQSGGELDWCKEVDDGRDTLVWLGEQDWCDGRVGLLGMSITSLAAFRLAADSSETSKVRVAALVNILGVIDFHSLFYRGGALALHWALPWTHVLAAGAKPVWQERDWRSLYRHLPLADVPGEGLMLEELWRRVVDHPAYDPQGDGPANAFWRELDSRPALARVSVPVLHVTGWWDFLLHQAIEAHRRLAEGDALQRLIVGPWHHQSLLGASDTAATGVDATQLMAAWFAAFLADDADARQTLEDRPEVSLWLGDRRKWLGAESFPPESARETSYRLAGHGTGEADDPGDGVGTLVADDGEGDIPAAGEVRFSYDPDDPAPTVGGAVWPFDAAGLIPGAKDQSGVEARPDVVTFTTPPLIEGVTLAGPVRVEMWAATDAADTDFTAKLVEVDAAGTPRILQDGIVRGRFRRGTRREEPLEPDRLHRFDLDLQAVGHGVAAGHRLRLEISSGNFPKFDRNLNSGDPPGRASRAVVAEQRVAFGAEHPSRLVLTTLPAGEAAARPDAEERDQGSLRQRWKKAFRRQMSSQFGRPHGLLGPLVGVVLGWANRRINAWTMELVDTQPEDRVLEIGFGPGRSIRETAKRLDGGRVSGIDVSETMLRTARRRNARAIRAGTVDLQMSSVEKLPFDDATFDRAYGVNSIQLWPEPVANLEEVRRVLKPGGRLVLTLQPRWVANDAQVRQIGLQVVSQMRAAGFAEARLEFQRTKPVASFSAIAARPS